MSGPGAPPMRVVRLARLHRVRLRAPAAMARNLSATAALPPTGASKGPGVQKSSGKRAPQANAAVSSPNRAWQSA